MVNTRHKIILVDDIQSNLDQGRNILRTFFEVYPALSAARLFEILERITPDLILLDIDMPEMNGYEAIKILKSDVRFAEIPVIFLTAKSDSESEVEGFNLGAADYVSKPFYAPMLLKRIEKELVIIKQRNDLLGIQGQLKDHMESLETLVQQKADAVMRMQNAVLSIVVDMVEFRDKFTGGHIIRTQHYLQALLDEMVKEGVYADEISDWDMFSVLSSAKLHDVGKIAVPDVILSKTAKLTKDEFEAMKSHVTASVDAIERILNKTGEDDFFHHAIRMAGTHHEKWDGSGYPIGLKGDNIPLEGRLMAIADVYDALISKRPYKEAFSHTEACRILEESAGTQFDPVLVDVFRNVERRFTLIAEEFSN